MHEMLLPPTPEILRASDVIDEVIERYLSICSTLPPPGEWEASDEAYVMMALAIRNAEALATLARQDQVLFPAAMVLARSAFEIGMTVSWMLDPEDPLVRETRWLRACRDREDFNRRTAKELHQAGADGSLFAKRADVLRDFHDAVAEKLPVHLQSESLDKGLPKMRERLRAMDQEQLYRDYIRSSQFTHGSQAATALYRRHLGSAKQFGEFVDASMWQDCFSLCWRGLYLGGRRYIERAGGHADAFLSSRFVDTAEKAFAMLGDSKRIAH